MSDSDSDFSSDMDKNLARSLDTFWDHYKSKQLTINHEGDDNQDEAASENLSIDPTRNVDADVEVLHPTTQTQSFETETISDNVVLVEQPNSNLCNAVDRLDKLTKILKDTLEGEAKPKRRCRRSARIQQISVKPRASRRKKIATVVEEPIYIDDDEVSKRTITHVEELNPMVTIKVLWKLVETKMFKVRKFQRLNCIFDYFVNKANVEPNRMYFTIDDKEINLQENSYVSLRLSAEKIIEGSTLPESYSDKRTHVVKKSGSISLKVQNSTHRSKQFNVHCSSGDKMEIVMWEVMRHVNKEIENIKLVFDGQVLKPSDTVEQLGLEDGDCFDLTVSN